MNTPFDHVSREFRSYHVDLVGYLNFGVGVGIGVVLALRLVCLS